MYCKGYVVLVFLHPTNSKGHIETGSHSLKSHPTSAQDPHYFQLESKMYAYIQCDTIPDKIHTYP